MFGPVIVLVPIGVPCEVAQDGGIDGSLASLLYFSFQAFQEAISELGEIVHSGCQMTVGSSHHVMVLVLNLFQLEIVFLSSVCVFGQWGPEHGIKSILHFWLVT